MPQSTEDSRLDLSRSDLPGKIQDNLIAYMRLFAGLPGMVMKEQSGPDEDIFWFVSHLPAPGDGILKVRWGEEGVEERIDRLFGEIGQHVEQIDWLIYPGDRPASLGRRLEARGMPGGLAGNWLWADLTDLPPAPAAPDGFRIAQVRDDRAMGVWLAASEAGFQGELGCFYDAYARHGYGPGAFSLHYIGYLGDTPVTSATLLDAGGTAAVYDLSTLPDYRRQGLGGALTRFLLAETRRRGYAETWIWASNMARSLYKTLGFVDADFGIREHKWGI